MSRTKGSGARTANNLTGRNSAALYSWLDREREWCAGATAQQCAVRAADQLGFGVTASNVLNVKRSLGISKPKPVATASECRCEELARIMLSWFAGPPSLQSNLQIRRRIAAFLGGKIDAPTSEPLPFRGTMGAQ